MKKLKQYKFLFIIMAIVCCFCFGTVAYSAIYTTMGISGVAYARLVKDVRVTDFRLNNLQGGASVSYTEFSKNTLSLNVNILDNSSIAVFDVEITNYGNADIGILQIVDKSSSGAFFNILNYEYGNKLCDSNGKCNNMAVSTIQIEVRGSAGEHNVNLEVDFRTFHSVTYTGITNNSYPTEVMDGGYLSVNFKEDLKRISVLSGGEEINYYESISSGETINVYNISNDIEFKQNEPPAKLVSGDLNTVGSEVCINDECFYIISNDGSTVAMLAKYNLRVGNSVSSSTDITLISNPTGIQDETVRGYIYDSVNGTNAFPYFGTTAFSSDEKKGTNYSDYSGSIVEEYVNNYNEYLLSQSISSLNGHLITYNELIALGCTDTSCSGAPSWVYDNSYWTGSSTSTTQVRYVNSRARHDVVDYNDNDSFGVRPVIEISVDDIYVEPTAEMVSGDYDTVGSEVAIGDEHFYVISSTDTTVTMLAKYNLYVGNSFDIDDGIVKSLTATGKQDSTALGFNNSPIDDMVVGVIPFSNDSQKGTNYSDYNGSIIEGYVNEYNNYLVTLGIKNNEARLISVEELEKLGCSTSTKNCSSTYPWVYSTSYWIGTAYDAESVYILFSENRLSNYGCTLSNFGGVRPVIIISKTNF